MQIADAFLDAPSEEMEMAIAEEYNKHGADIVLNKMKQGAMIAEDTDNGNELSGLPG